jgi:hypothetical protein
MNEVALDIAARFSKSHYYGLKVEQYFRLRFCTIALTDHYWDRRDSSYHPRKEASSAATQMVHLWSHYIHMVVFEKEIGAHQCHNKIQE